MWSKLGTRYGDLLVFCCGWLLAGPGGCSGSQARAELRDARGDPSCAVAGFIPYWDQDRAVESFRAHSAVIDSIAVFWYGLDPEGNVRPFEMARQDRELIALAHEHGVKVFALVANLPDSEREGDELDWDPARVGRPLGSAERRAAHIAELTALTRRLGFDGVYIDYEALPGRYRDKFTKFIEELGEALHAEDKLLAVALHPKTAEDNPQEDNGSHAQDWGALRRHADQLHLMTYNQHTAATDPGPVASPAWVEAVLRYAISEREVPRAKLYMGLPLYGEEWQQLDSDRYRGLGVDITFADAQQRRQEHDGSQRWSAEHDSPYIVFRDHDDSEHVLWFENQRSVREKLALAAELGLCNISMWRLGGEDPGVWQLIEEARRAWRAAGSGAPPEHRKEAPEARRMWLWRLLGRGLDGYPRFFGEASLDVEYYATFAATTPENERDNWVTNMDIESAFNLTPALALHGEARVVLESDGEDERFYSEFPYEGVYIRSLFLRYQASHFSVFAGKYEPAADIRGYPPIYFGNYSTELSLEDSIGVGGTVTLADDALGRHTLTGHLFQVDTSALSGELLTGQGEIRRADGGAGNTGRPNNYLVTLNGGTDGTGAIFRYTLGGGVQRHPGNSPDEHAYVGALYGELPIGPGDIELSVDLLSLRNAGETDRHSIGLGLAYSDWPLGIGAACSLRSVDPGSGADDRVDVIVEIVARYGIGGFLVEAAYQNVRERGEQDSSVGVVVSYWVDWLVN